MREDEEGSQPTNATAGWLMDPDVVVFGGGQELPVGAMERHGPIERVAGKLFGKNHDAVRQDWTQVLEQIYALIGQVPRPLAGYAAEEITFELGFSAEGKIVFVAQAGVSTTISVTFRRALADEPSE